MKTTEYTDQNRRAWDEIAAVRHKKWPGAGFFAGGGSMLDRRALAAVGDAKGVTVCHLQCSTGEDTLSWATQGAVATGVDISVAQIELARRKAEAAGLPVRFIAADVYDLPAELSQASFDVVYTGGGALVWLPDIRRWAQVVADLLRTGGLLVLNEEHPVVECLEVVDGHIEVTGNYFGREAGEYGGGWTHFAGGQDATEVSYQFTWPLGDVVTSLARAGLKVESLEELPSNAEWRFPDQLDRVKGLPGAYWLIARK